jgi:hypothetical protein
MTQQEEIRRTYNHAEYLSDRAMMMQRWADMLDSWKKVRPQAG